MHAPGDPLPETGVACAGAWRLRSSLCILSCVILAQVEGRRSSHTKMSLTFCQQPGCLGVHGWRVFTVRERLTGGAGCGRMGAWQENNGSYWRYPALFAGGSNRRGLPLMRASHGFEKW